MFRGTTPTFTLNIQSDISFDDIQEMWITIEDSKTEITYSLSQEEIVLNADEKKAELTMSQEDTLKLHDANVKLQARLLLNNGKAFASDVNKIALKDILKEGVIE